MPITDHIKSLFANAKEKDEFEFISTLINYRGMGDAKGTSNLYEWFDAVSEYEALYNAGQTQEKKARIGLLLYSAFFESSDLYNVLGSLARIQLGYKASSYLFFKHEKSNRWLGIGEKFSMVQELLMDSGNNDIQQFFENIFVVELRNSFIHSSYSILQGEYIIINGEPITFNGVGQYSVNIDQFILPKINDVIVFFNAFKTEFIFHYKSYTQNKIVRGRFPVLQDITVLGSATGLKGFIAGGSYIKQQDDGMWIAMNIRFNHQSEEDLLIKDEMAYFIKKDTIKTNDGRLQGLYNFVIKRKNAAEFENLSIIYEKFAVKLSELVKTEANYFKQTNLYEHSLTFFQKSIELSKNRDCRNRMAVVKAMLADRKNDTNLDEEAAADFIICLKEKMELTTAKNISVILTTLKRRGKDIEKFKEETIAIVSAVKEGDSHNDILSVVEEIKKL